MHIGNEVILLVMIFQPDDVLIRPVKERRTFFLYHSLSTALNEEKESLTVSLAV